MKVTCESELTGIDGRKLTFYVKAYDEKGVIGEGTHERFIIQNEKFQKKANMKKDSYTLHIVLRKHICYNANRQREVK